MNDRFETPVPHRSFKIIPAGWRDLNGLRQLEKVCFPKDAWPLWDLIGVLTMPNVIRLKAVLVASDGVETPSVATEGVSAPLAGDKMVGFVAGDVRGEDHLAWIVTIGVLPEYRRIGIGLALLQACEAHIRQPRVRLNVRTGNTGAIRLYAQHGYYKVSTWPGYYQDGEDALVMEKQL